tara:strand:- start:349 stop:663 length:315 start_codon:yes stop_codon:yes gene_type:complete
MIDKIKEYIRPLIERPRYVRANSNNKTTTNQNKKPNVIQELVSGSIENTIEDKKAKPVTKSSKRKYKKKSVKPPVKHSVKKPKPPIKKEEVGVFKQLKDKLKRK